MSGFITEEAVKAAARAVYEARNGKGAYPFHIKPRSHQQEYINDVLAALPHIEKAIREDEREKCAVVVQNVAAIIDHPSVYMGGPSRNAIRKCDDIAAAIRARKE